MKQFEDMTVAELKKLHEQFIAQNPDVPTAAELLDDLNKKREE